MSNFARPKLSNFARPKLSNFARSKSLTLNFGQHGLDLQLTIWVKFCYNVIRKMKK